MYSMRAKIRPEDSHISNSISNPNQAPIVDVLSRKWETICNDPKDQDQHDKFIGALASGHIQYAGQCYRLAIETASAENKELWSGISSVSFNVVCSCSVLPRSALLENRRFLVSLCSFSEPYLSSVLRSYISTGQRLRLSSFNSNSSQGHPSQIMGVCSTTLPQSFFLLQPLLSFKTGAMGGTET